MARTAEELAVMRSRGREAHQEKLRKERRAAARRQKRDKVRGGELIDSLKLSDAEVQGLIKDAENKVTRDRWRRLGSVEADRKFETVSGGVVPRLEDAAE